jgi:tripartite-type tricarboxylate transporter receptor subunit TctC
VKPVRPFFKVALAILSSVACATTALAAYPDKPIRLIVPYAPGATAGALSQLIGNKLGAELGQVVVVEPKPGANGNIASEFVARSAPDGYTLLIGTISTLTINPSLYKKMAFDPMKDFKPISMLVTTQNVIVLNPSVPANTLPELVQYARANPGKLTYGSSGAGSTLHLPGELLKSMTNTDMLHVAYKGGGPARADLLAGNISMMFSDMTALPLVQSGRLRALAVTGSKREPAAPNIPTASEAGLPGYVVESWYGVLAPAGTPDSIVKTLSTAVAAVLQKPEVRERLIEMGTHPAENATPEYLDNAMKSDHAKWAAVIKAAGIKLE